MGDACSKPSLSIAFNNSGDKLSSEKSFVVMRVFPRRAQPNALNRAGAMSVAFGFDHAKPAGQRALMKSLFALSAILLVMSATFAAETEWRALPLVTDGKVDTNWVHVGWGGFIVDDGVLRTDPS